MEEFLLYFLAFIGLCTVVCVMFLSLVLTLQMLVKRRKMNETASRHIQNDNKGR